MLPQGLWKEYEPRMGFPIFKNCVNRVSQAIRVNFGQLSLRKAAKINYLRLKQGKLPNLGTLVPFITGGGCGAMNIRGALCTRQGEFVRNFGVLGRFQAGQTFEINVNDVLAQHEIPLQDAMFMMIMDIGDHPEALSDINIFSMSYEGEHFFTNYRTGAFARTLNDFSKKKHVGFLGINPKIVVNDTHVSSLLFINHSSNPEYNDTVYPKVKLYRQDGDSIESDFGPIPAFGGIERSMEEIFPEARDFLRCSGGLGTTVSQVDGYTLASISILKSRDEKTMSIEHTRPTQSYLLNGI